MFLGDGVVLTFFSIFTVVAFTCVSTILGWLQLQIGVMGCLGSKVMTLTSGVVVALVVVVVALVVVVVAGVVVVVVVVVGILVVAFVVGSVSFV